MSTFDLTQVYLNLSIENLPGESWKDVLGFEGKYLVSNYGRVKLLWKFQYSYFVGGIYTINNPKICKGSWFKGYRQISLHANGEETKKFVHKMVAESFLQKESFHDTVDHINMVKTQNNVENLRWTTRSQNTIWAQEQGVTGNLFTPKFTQDQVVSIFKDKRSLDELASIYNVDRTTISRIRTGSNYKRFTKDLKR